MDPPESVVMLLSASLPSSGPSSFIQVGFLSRQGQGSTPEMSGYGVGRGMPGQSVTGLREAGDHSGQPCSVRYKCHSQIAF